MTAAQRLADAKAKMSKVGAALCSVGIPDDYASRIGPELDSAGRLAALITAATARQAIHDVFVNLPCGILSPAEPLASARRAMAGAIGAWLEWDIRDALALCADILDDVNAHPEAAKVRAMLDRDNDIQATENPNERAKEQNMSETKHMSEVLKLETGTYLPHGSADGQPCIYRRGVKERLCILDEGEEDVCELIVRAVNTHDELVTALQAAVDIAPNDMLATIWGAEARAAIAKAEGREP